MADKTFMIIIVLISMLTVSYQLEVTALQIKRITEAELAPC